MQNYLQSNGSLSVCHKGSCIYVRGRNAELIAVGTFAMLLLIGMAILSRNIQNVTG